MGVGLTTAAADPVSTTPPGDPHPPLVLSPLPLFDAPTPTAVPSLRIEAARVAAERFADSWRYPEPGPLLGYERGAWFVGTGFYRPRSRRAAALHTGSVAATILGEVLVGLDSPLAGVGALLTGATLDAAAADADRDAEASR